MRPDWYPDWRGEACVLVAAGPSAAAAPLSCMKGLARFIAINRSIELCPWADMLYGADRRFFEHYRDLWRNFPGLKVSQHEGLVADYPEIHHVKLKAGDHNGPSGLVFEDGTIGAGGNSGHQALNLAAQLGPDPIILCGFDMHLNGGTHWHGRHPSPLNNPDENALAAWRKYFSAAAPVLAARRITVINATPGSALTCFPFSPLQEIARGLARRAA